MRGKARSLKGYPFFGGITPACAGKSHRHRDDRERERDHPRVCGEKMHAGYVDGRLLGSPPRVRGKEVRDGADVDADRITPACAGKRPPSIPSLYSVQDHPRVCGEKADCAAVQWNGMGSPPRVRGKEQRKRITREETGITPACAGKSHAVGQRVKVIQDHPRVCGEKATCTEARFFTAGSPPRVRGKG